MNKKEYAKVEKAFKDYYENYKNRSSGIILKYGHSFNVADYMYDLADRLYLDEEDKYLAKTIGLLHDIGRFEQLLRYDSYDDSKFNHAVFGGVYLFDEGHIRDFIDNDKDDNVIKEAIINHNRYEINDGLSDRELLFAKMIRDMDKVDIYYQVGIKLPMVFSGKPSKKVLDDFFDGKSIYGPDTKTKSDYVIEFLAFINDINFDESIEILRESDNLGLFISNIDIENDEETFNKLKDYCYKKIGIEYFN
jgi:putative nucleotidyltransferase with HDIG domain